MDFDHEDSGHIEDTTGSEVSACAEEDVEDWVDSDGNVETGVEIWDEPRLIAELSGD